MAEGEFRTKPNNPSVPTVIQEPHPDQMYLPDMHPSRFCRAAIMPVVVEVKFVELPLSCESADIPNQAQAVVGLDGDTV